MHLVARWKLIVWLRLRTELTSRWWTVRASSLCDVKILYREDVLQAV